MKKMLVLMLVAGMGSLASAGLILTPDDDAIYGAGTPVTIGVDSITGIEGFEFAIEVVGGTINIDDLAFPGPWMFPPYIKSSSETYVDVTGGNWGELAALTVVEGITVTRTEDVLVVTLVATGNNILAGETVGAGTVFDTIVTPEPMTMVLFGLGGLFLRRRNQEGPY